MNKVNSIQLDKPRDSGNEIEITPQKENPKKITKPN